MSLCHVSINTDEDEEDDSKLSSAYIREEPIFETSSTPTMTTLFASFSASLLSCSSAVCVSICPVESCNVVEFPSEELLSNVSNLSIACVAVRFTWHRGLGGI